VFLLNGVGATNAAPLGAQILDYYLTRQKQQAATGAAAPTGQTQPAVTP
jgi:hypothetical protein